MDKDLLTFKDIKLMKMVTYWMLMVIL